MKPLQAMAAHWPALNRLLDEALALPPGQRADWLARLDGDDAALRDPLAQLLAPQSRLDDRGFLVALPTLDPPTPQDALVAGATVGPYRLVRPLGEGGMGLVWEAERTDGLVKRRVALKLPRAAWGGSLAERLARERDILAGLEHAHIARLYDAGVDAQGRPYLAMALVDGEPITTYCERHQLDVRARVGLLLQVAAAVAHAHARLVVHRDLKPSNILVTGEGQVQLLDFGVAKLLDEGHTRSTTLTALSGRAMTLDYASPEQIAGLPLGTASDVYSLAVVAYELLSGSRPYRLKRGTAAELEEAIAAAEVRPASAAAARPEARRALRGDLDAILNRAMKQQPQDRYPTMDAFAQDLVRWRDGVPVQAQPDRLGYRTRKFVARHRVQVGAAVLVAGALVGGSALAWWQAVEARRAAATAEAVQAFIESVFNANSRDQPDVDTARATPARALLDRGAQRIGQELASAPEAQLRLYELLARMYVGMGLNDQALVMERQAWQRAKDVFGERSDLALNAAANIGLSLDGLGQRDEALAVLLQADAAARGRLFDHDHARLSIDTALAHVYFNADPPLGLARARSAAALARRMPPSEDGLGALFILGENARRAGHLAEARQALMDAEVWIARTGVQGATADVLSSLGEVQDELGELAAAGATLTRAIPLAEATGDPNTLHVARYKLARYLFENRLLREALDATTPEAAWARGLPPDHTFGDLPSVVLVNHGRSLTAYGDAAAGLVAIDQARALLPPTAGDRLGPLLTARADALAALGRLDEAQADVAQALALMARGGARGLRAAQAVQRRCWVAAGQAAQALQDLRGQPPLTGETATPALRVRQQAEEAWLLLRAGQLPQAQARASDGLAALAQVPERRYERDAQARLRAVLGEALLRQGQTASAIPVLRQALTEAQAAYEPAHSPPVVQLRQLLATAGAHP